MRRELLLRLTIGPALVAVVMLGFAFDLNTGRHWALLSFAALAIPFACRELRQLALSVVGPVQVLPTLVISFALLLAAWISADPVVRDTLTVQTPKLSRLLASGRLPLEALLIGIGLVWATFIQMRRRAYEHFFTNIALTLFGVLYIGLTVNLVMHLAGITGDAAYYGILAGSDPATGAAGSHGGDNPGRGTQLVALYLASCKLGDTTAFFGGRAFGRHKMAPRISPGKTWEGFAFSFVGAIGGAYAVAGIFAATCAHGPFNGWWQPAVWGLVLGPLGVVGDLAESCMKREAAAKDSGTLIPGFGGMLDIFDALVLAAPVAYVLALVL